MVGSNSLAVIDSATNRVVDGIPIGDTPGPVAVSREAVWVGNVAKNTLIRIDPTTHRVVDQLGLGVAPDWVAYAAGALWIVDDGCEFPCAPTDLARSGPLTVTRFDVSRLVSGRPIKLGAGGPVRINVAGNDQAVWVTNRIDSRVYRIDPVSGMLAGEIPVADAAAVAAGENDAWVVSKSRRTIECIDPNTDEVTSRVKVGNDPEGLAVSGVTVWVANFGPEAAVWRVDTRFDELRGTVPVTGGPTVVAAPEGAVWIGHYQRGAVSRIDTETNSVAATIELGQPAYHLAASESLVWVTVR